MKNLLAGIAFLGTVAFASAQTITFDNTTFEYGNIKPGSDGTRFFTVTNTGDKPLVLSNVKPSCGCTTPEWSQDPILPGKSAKIKVGYNTALAGPFTKMIEVFSNDPVNSRSIIYIKGNVDPNAADPAPEPVVEAKVLTPEELKAEQEAEKKAAKIAAKEAKKAEKEAKRAARKAAKAAN
ncbi:hypothetical protein ASG31_10980 [Chryseobacterium sp. Leaf404]|uniref:DUF1573 domain-containing protein n=1 Tax=unclassified Chryseobacterium TaxID=2593645 RepID=UPI0006FD9D5D|nr:DUF1573 domain-containing protein [Chryseobacterium sp. Leaf313]KQT16889.1 hypothetical protein ASG31_10980 [Chryseobacterium sp. Leaf404]